MQWDTFRTLYPLMSLHDPENFARIVRGMVNIHQHEGWLPECRGATVMHYVQGGSGKHVRLLENAIVNTSQMPIRYWENFS